ncbi:MAG: hypothetical protein R8M45_03345, partial [Ghiorsea sp.]
MNAKDAESPKVPESQSTIGLQLLEMVQGEATEGRKGVFIADGTQLPNTPQGMRTANVNGGKLIVWKGKDGEQSVESYKAGQVGEVLGYGTNEKAVDTAHLTTQVMVDGKIAKQVVGVSPEIMHEAERTAQQLGGTVGIVNTQDSLRQRIEQLKAETLGDSTGVTQYTDQLPAPAQEQQPTLEGEVQAGIAGEIAPPPMQALPSPEMSGVFATDPDGNTIELSVYEQGIIEKIKDDASFSGEIAVDPDGNSYRLSKGISEQLAVSREHEAAVLAEQGQRDIEGGMSESLGVAQNDSRAEPIESDPVKRAQDVKAQITPVNDVGGEFSYV